jgi:uncharacterized protein YrzB (UPF0473 family)
MEIDMDEIITLTDEDGISTDFKLIAKLDIEDEEYAVVAPIESDSDEAIALKIERISDEEYEFVTVEDDETLDMISEAYETLMDDENLN